MQCLQWTFVQPRLGNPHDSESLATPTGLEPATSAVTGRRANRLRYGALHPQRGSNPCYRRERAVSLATRRWGPVPVDQCEPLATEEVYARLPGAGNWAANPPTGPSPALRWALVGATPTTRGRNARVPEFPRISGS
jgi:hypothetical protein